jgi:hypothetical protein
MRPTWPGILMNAYRAIGAPWETRPEICRHREPDGRRGAATDAPFHARGVDNVREHAMRWSRCGPSTADFTAQEDGAAHPFLLN